MPRLLWLLWKPRVSSPMHPQEEGELGSGSQYNRPVQWIIEPAAAEDTGGVIRGLGRIPPPRVRQEECFLPFALGVLTCRMEGLTPSRTRKPTAKLEVRCKVELSSYSIPLCPCPVISRSWDDLCYTTRVSWMRGGSLRNPSSLPHSCSFNSFVPGLAVAS